MNNLSALLSETTEHAGTLTLDDVRGIADLLVAHGRREDAVELVSATLETLDDPRAQFLLARLYLESETRIGAEKALTIIGFWRRISPENPEGIALQRCALRELGRGHEVADLDRDVGWLLWAVKRPALVRPQS
jgi:hypothetical protein